MLVMGEKDAFGESACGCLLYGAFILVWVSGSLFYSQKSLFRNYEVCGKVKSSVWDRLRYKLIVGYAYSLNGLVREISVIIALSVSDTVPLLIKQNAGDYADGSVVFSRFPYWGIGWRFHYGK